MILLQESGRCLPGIFQVLQISGDVTVSTGIMQLVKLSACSALNGKIKYKRERRSSVRSLTAAVRPGALTLRDPGVDYVRNDAR